MQLWTVRDGVVVFHKAELETLAVFHVTSTGRKIRLCRGDYIWTVLSVHQLWKCWSDWDGNAK